MFKKILFVFVAFGVFHACSDDPKAVGDYENINVGAVNDSTGMEKPMLEEGDYFGMAKSALMTLQQEYNKCEGKAGLGKVTVFLDQNFNLLIKNEVGGDVIETKVNLKDLNPENGGFKLLPDDAPGQFPGIQLIALNGDKDIEISKNGKVVSNEYHLDIRMAERKNIQTIAPAMVQAVSAAHGKY